MKRICCYYFAKLNESKVWVGVFGRGGVGWGGGRGYKGGREHL